MENGLQASNRNQHIHTHHKELSKEQQLKLNSEIQNSIVYDYLKTIAELNSK